MTATDAAPAEAKVLPFRPRAVQHLVRLSQLHLGVAETRCGSTVELRPAAATAGLPICPKCQETP